MPQPVVITLNVTNAETLFNLVNPTQAQIEALCILSDDNSGSSPNNNIEDFTSTVFINNNVKWQGTTDTPPRDGYTVAINSIVYEPDSNDPTDVNFFDTLASSGGRSANVNGNVRNDEVLRGKHDVYTINFSVYNSGNNFKPLHIDPKLRVDPLS